MNKKGFTLIELLAVVVVLSVLVLIAIPAISGILRSGRDQATDINYDTVLNAAYDYVLAEEVSVETEQKIPVCELINHGFLKQDTKDGNENLLNGTDYVKVTKVSYSAGTEYESGPQDKYFNNYHFEYVKSDGSVTCEAETSN